MNTHLNTGTIYLLVFLALSLGTTQAQEAAKGAPLPVAILNFSETGESVEGLGEKTSLLLSACLLYTSDAADE